MTDYAHACDEIRQYEQVIACARHALEQSDPDSLEARVVADALGRAAAVAESMTADLCPQRVQGLASRPEGAASSGLLASLSDDDFVHGGRSADPRADDKKADDSGKS